MFRASHTQHSVVFSSLSSVLSRIIILSCSCLLLAPQWCQLRPAAPAVSSSVSSSRQGCLQLPPAAAGGGRRQPAAVPSWAPPGCAPSRHAPARGAPNSRGSCPGENPRRPSCHARAGLRCVPRPGSDGARRPPARPRPRRRPATTGTSRADGRAGDSTVGRRRNSDEKMT